MIGEAQNYWIFDLYCGYCDYLFLDQSLVCFKTTDHKTCHFGREALFLCLCVTESLELASFRRAVAETVLSDGKKKNGFHYAYFQNAEKRAVIGFVFSDGISNWS